ncbi:MAG: DNA replication/repair protein RecF [Pseudomonadota bacterium]
MYVAQLNISHFRNYAQTRLADIAGGFVLLTGPNGAGKTNVLEAISLLSPGKGLRGAQLAELQSRDGDTVPWAVAARIAGRHGVSIIGTGYDATRDKRQIRIDGRDTARQVDLQAHLTCLWLTPQMDRLFLDGPSARRKLLDRLVFSLDPSHVTRLNRFERLMGERSRLLKAGEKRDSWLHALEVQMAEGAVAITAARQDVLRRLNATSRTHGVTTPFPPLTLQLLGDVEDWLAQYPALQAEQIMVRELMQARSRDAISGGARFGPHRSDMQVFDADRQMPADTCSTGEQKAMLISLTLLQAHLLRVELGQDSVLLLDEIAAHLDKDRRAALYVHLKRLGGQIWLTGTDVDVYADILADATHFHVQDGQCQCVA